MAKKILQYIDSAYRTNLEEQDDPTIWITQVLLGAGGQVDVILAGAAVNYALAKQDASGLAIGKWIQHEPPRIATDISRLVAKGASVWLLAEDFEERGLQKSELVPGVSPVRRRALAELLSSYDAVWRW